MSITEKKIEKNTTATYPTYFYDALYMKIDADPKTTEVTTHFDYANIDYYEKLARRERARFFRAAFISLKNPILKSIKWLLIRNLGKSPSIMELKLGGQVIIAI